MSSEIKIDKIIVRNGITSSQVKTLLEDDIKDMYGLINGRLINQSKKTGFEIDFKDHTFDCNVIEEMLNLCPMYCNFLFSRKYRNILFISHMDIKETKWIKEGRGISEIHRDVLKFGYPPSKVPNRKYVDLDKIIHFLPIFMHEWPFDTQCNVARPNQERYSGTLHQIYDRFGVPSVKVSCQYEHGISSRSWNLPDYDGAKFDAVVFLNVPLTKSDKPFSLNDIKPIFENYVTGDCEFIDILGGLDDERFVDDKKLRFVGDKELDIRSNITQSLDLRHQVLEEGENGFGCLREENEFLNSHISVYK